jgi:KaiC/GvpD/RAD55 family RecA-like ATPase
MIDQPALAAHHQHAVQFYENEESLYLTVAGFLSQGLVDGQPAILIATDTHRTAILKHLEARLVDVVKAQRTGDLIILGAQDTLDELMRDDTPDAAAFNASLGGIVNRMLKSRPKHTLIRAYGEMVDVLWKDGKADAAIRLEMLWNQLAMSYGFALLCGYSMGNFYKETERFEEVCRQHAHIVPPRPPATPVPPNYSAR